ncbi:MULTISPECIES: glycosyltransferase [unclassified Clostridium]|uniref:glycosyltransferase n=1 Tax=unclassified Clostridium TaxID=2614128 RepID=UPI0011064C23|nr:MULTISPECIES: glycosyltransferase [unclassified Clostridium]
MEWPVRVLQITIGDGTFSGIANFLYSFYSHMNHEKVRFDFLYCGENSLASKMGSSVLRDSKITTLHVMKRNNNGFKEYYSLIKELRRYFEDNRYHIIHINSSNLFVNTCITCMCHKKNICIGHSHNTKSPIEYSSFIKKQIKKTVRIPCQKYIVEKDNWLLACSTQAGEYLYSEKAVQGPKFKVINNAIDINKYIYNPMKRKLLRTNDKIIFGTVGRLTNQKNPLFLIDIFNEIHKKNGNTMLWLVGDGELRHEVEEKVKHLGLNNDIVIMGVRNDIADLMQAMDIFLLPSLYEGLAFVLIEAQAAGLPIFVSDSVTKEAKVTNLLEYIPLSIGAKGWADTILSKLENIPERRNTGEQLIKAGFDICTEAKKLEEFYISLMV